MGNHFANFPEKYEPTGLRACNLTAIKVIEPDAYRARLVTVLPIIYQAWQPGSQGSLGRCLSAVCILEDARLQWMGPIIHYSHVADDRPTSFNNRTTIYQGFCSSLTIGANHFSSTPLSPKLWLCTQLRDKADTTQFYGPRTERFHPDPSACLIQRAQTCHHWTQLSPTFPPRSLQTPARKCPLRAPTIGDVISPRHIHAMVHIRATAVTAAAPRLTGTFGSGGV